MHVHLFRIWSGTLIGMVDKCNFNNSISYCLQISEKRQKVTKIKSHGNESTKRWSFPWKIFDLNLNSSSFASIKYTEKLRFSCDWQGGTETQTTTLTRSIMKTMIYISRVKFLRPKHRDLSAHETCQLCQVYVITSSALHSMTISILWCNWNSCSLTGLRPQ